MLKIFFALALLLSLNGCVVVAAADLAATTVFTAGKIAVKATGAVVDAVISDDDDKTDQKNKSANTPQPQPSDPAASEYQQR